MGFPFVDYTLYDILLDDPKEAASIRNKEVKFYYDVILQTRIISSMMTSCSIAYQRKGLRRYSKKPTVGLAVPANRGQSFGTV